MSAMFQSQLLVPTVTRDRADALVLVLDVPRAAVFRMALDGAGLAGVEATYAGALARLDAVAERMGLDRLTLARKATEDGFKLADLEGRRRYPVRKTQA